MNKEVAPGLKVFGKHMIQKIAGLKSRSLFGRPRLEWRASMHDFLQEYSTVEDKYAAVLEGTDEMVSEFLARLACRLSMKGDITEDEKPSRSRPLLLWYRSGEGMEPMRIPRGIRLVAAYRH